MSQLITHLIPIIHHLLEKITLLFIPLFLFMLSTGIEGIIEKESPDSLASFGSVSSSFFNFIGMHSMIIVGALGITSVIWFLTRNLWTTSDEYIDASQYIDEYEEFVGEELANEEKYHYSMINSENMTQFHR
jgi:hypothetical protein